MGQYINENIEYIERIRYRIKEFLFSVHNSKTRLKEVISNLEDSESVFNSILLYTYLNTNTRPRSDFVSPRSMTSTVSTPMGGRTPSPPIRTRPMSPCPMSPCPLPGPVSQSPTPASDCRGSMFSPATAAEKVNMISDAFSSLVSNSKLIDIYEDEVRQMIRNRIFSDTGTIAARELQQIYDLINFYKSICDNVETRIKELTNKIFSDKRQTETDRDDCDCDCGTAALQRQKIYELINCYQTISDKINTRIKELKNCIKFLSVRRQTDRDGCDGPAHGGESQTETDRDGPAPGGERQQIKDKFIFLPPSKMFEEENSRGHPSPPPIYPGGPGPGTT